MSRGPIGPEVRTCRRYVGTIHIIFVSDEDFVVLR